MASKKQKMPKVTLSTLRFTNWQEVPDSDSESESEQQQRAPTKIAEIPQPTNPFPYDFKHPEVYERMAGDKPGTELAHDATIWKLYLEEANEHDQELVKSRHASLDMLLLFAALFSAILTAFIIESKDLLQRDPVDTSAALLLMIARSQQRMELGLPTPETTAPVDFPSFSPPLSARWINGIWFSSLGLSLSAALIAMLSKEWLTAYLSSRPRPPRAHAHLRQSRLEGLERWWALHIIALLPSVLHLSLFLFSIGLVLYLWTLDTIIAGVIAGIIGLTGIFYISTAILGAIYDFCPYVTQVSGYIKTASDAHRNAHRPVDEETPDFTSASDLRALLWLANHARDPAVVDCSYQALAGLHFPTGSSQSTYVDAPREKILPLSDRMFLDIPVQLDNETTLDSLFMTVHQRFKRLMENHNVLSAHGYANAARYMNAIIALASYIKVDCSSALDGEGSLGREKRLDRITTSTYSPILEALSASENLWSDNIPSLHADVYANFVANELVMLSLALPNSAHVEATLLSNSAGPSSGGRKMIARGDHVINIVSHSPSHRQNSHLPLLRAQYSRTLARANALIWLHMGNEAPIGTVPLCKLLRAIRTAATCHALNPTTGYSTHHPQSAYDDTREFEFVIPNTGGSYSFLPQDLDSGLLGTLIGLLNMDTKGQGESAIQTRIAAVQAFSTLAPVILQQVLGLDRDELLQEFGSSTWLEGAILDMNTARYAATRQMLVILRCIGKHLTFHPGLLDLFHSALDLIDTHLEENQYQEQASMLALTHCGAYLIPLLESISVDNAALDSISSGGAWNLLDMVQLTLNERDNLTLCDIFFPPSCFPPLIRLIKIVDDCDTGVEMVLKSVVGRMRNSNGKFSSQTRLNAEIPPVEIPSIQYLHRFTHLAGGFFALSQAGSNESYVEPVVEATVQIVHLAAGRDSGLVVEHIELHTAAVPGFLDAVAMVAKHCMDVPERDQMLLDFSRDVIELLVVAFRDKESRSLIGKHPMRDALYTSLKAIQDNHTASKLLERIARAGAELKVRSQTEGSATQPESPSSDSRSDQSGKNGGVLPLSPGDLADGETHSDGGGGWTDDE